MQSRAHPFKCLGEAETRRNGENEDQKNNTYIKKTRHSELVENSVVVFISYLRLFFFFLRKRSPRGTL